MAESSSISKFDSFDSFHQATHKKLNDVSGHSDAEYDRFHDILIVELGRIGSVEEGGLESGDFSVDRTVGDSLPIGVVVETKIQGIIEVVQAALTQIDADYSVLLDLEDSDIAVSKNGGLAVFSEYLDPEDVLRSLAI